MQVTKPALAMGTIAMLTAAGDLGHFSRMQQLATAGKRPAAVLFADLEGSTQLAKRLPTASYFTLVRRLTRAADKCVIDAGGLVGRHAGDGVTAFFVAETAGSESAAARACISAVRALQAATRGIAARHDLAADEIVVRAGLHWGATLYIGSIVTSGRSEVTALGDEVNEAARMEACASGGRALASKPLLERLNTEVEVLEGAIQRRAVIERAKGILMERHSIGDREAFELLRTHARANNRKLVDVAGAVADGHLLLPRD